MRSKAWLAAPVLLAHAEVTENINILSMGPKLRHTAVFYSSFGTKSVMWFMLHYRTVLQTAYAHVLKELALRRAIPSHQRKHPGFI
jgi:hypothetical protein